jgi:hypothetical protein
MDKLKYEIKKGEHGWSIWTLGVNIEPGIYFNEEPSPQEIKQAISKYEKWLATQPDFSTWIKFNDKRI